jgi:hypothetical protein
MQEPYATFNLTTLLPRNICKKRRAVQTKEKGEEQKLRNNGKDILSVCECGENRKALKHL